MVMPNCWAIIKVRLLECLPAQRWKARLRFSLSPQACACCTRDGDVNMALNAVLYATALLLLCEVEALPPLVDSCYEQQLSRANVG
jgi:hypothetical protein